MPLRRWREAVGASYYGRVWSVATRDARGWARHHIAADVGLVAVTTAVMLIAGLPTGAQSVWYFWSPVLALCVVLIVVLVAHLLVTPVRMDRTTHEFIDRWNPRDIDAEVETTDPFIYRRPDGRRFLVVPRLSLINRDQQKAAILDVSLSLTVRGADYRLTMELNRVQPDLVAEAMDEFQVGGSFIGKQVRIPKEDRLYGFVTTDLPDFEMYPQSINDITSISLEFRDPIVKWATYSSVEI